MIESPDFRAAMARLGAAVNIITTDGPGGRHGMTASAVCSISDTPASLLVCINKSARMHALVEANGVLCVNVLSAGQEPLSALFAGHAASADERFAQGSWSAMANGAAALSGALCTFGCRVTSIHEVGTHSMFVCAVEELRMREDGDGLVYFGRAYHRLPQTVTS